MEGGREGGGNEGGKEEGRERDREKGWEGEEGKECFPTALGNTEMNYFCIIRFSTCTSIFCSTPMDEGTWGSLFS